ncbi:MAG: hypothetical protein FWC54_03405 [Actinomycetia bacterium]|nr:hypothetical protein [Actinomycetes bacterium]
MDFPIKIADILKLGKNFITAQKQGLRLMIYVDPRSSDALVAEVCELFRPLTGRSQVLVRILSGQPEADVALIAHERKSAARLLLCARVADLRSLEPFPPATCVVTGGELRSDAARELASSILDVASPLSGDLEEQLALWLSTTLPTKRLTLAGDFLFTQRAVAHDICSVTSWQNAAIALVPFTRGADMPVLVANQVKMLMQLALSRGLKLDARRIPELLATGVVALLGRRLARRFAFRFPPLRWLARGAVAYALTWALGQAAQRYYERRACGLQEHEAFAALNAAERHLVAAGHDDPVAVLRGLLSPGEQGAAAGPKQSSVAAKPAL